MRRGIRALRGGVLRAEARAAAREGGARGERMTTGGRGLRGYLVNEVGHVRGHLVIPRRHSHVEACNRTQARDAKVTHGGGGISAPRPLHMSAFRVKNGRRRAWKASRHWQEADWIDWSVLLPSRTVVHTGSLRLLLPDFEAGPQVVAHGERKVDVPARA